MNGTARYARQARLIGSNGQIALSQSQVLCIGAGGLGSLVSTYLVASGVGTIGLVDGDTIELSNLTRQISYKEADCGTDKVITQAQFLRKLNSTCRVTAHNYFLQQNNANELIGAYDVIVDCTDNFRTRYLINDICVAHEKPLISASIDAFMGQILLLFGDVCYRCLFPEVNNEANDSCFNGDVLGPSVGIIASLQANEVIKFITGLNKVSRLIQVDSLENTMTTFALRPDTACINHHGDIALNQEVQPLQFAQALELYATKQVQFIDIRDNNSFPAIDSLKIAASQITKSNQSISQDKPIVVICNYGFRSKLAALQLAAMGCYSKIYYSSITATCEHI